MLPWKHHCDGMAVVLDCECVLSRIVFSLDISLCMKPVDMCTYVHAYVHMYIRMYSGLQNGCRNE